jgi:hypothetical protein
MLKKFFYIKKKNLILDERSFVKIPICSLRKNIFLILDFNKIGLKNKLEFSNLKKK